ncbi:MAG: deoxynucleoside kinase [Ignavibacteriae bacterium]|nr:deoxynucleoside kinase [Ignavibacteriota bacterium]
MIQQSELRYIAIEGVIGAGKTTLANMLGEAIGAKVVLEQFEENPFLKDFYKDPERYAFQTQIFFLLTRYKQQRDLGQADLFHRFLVTDYIFEKDKIFAYLNLQDEELKLYETLVSSIQHNMPSPDLVVYLQSNVPRLMGNIRFRGREFESNMQESYIRDLNEAYNYFFFRYKTTPLLIVNSIELDFVSNKEHFEDLVRAIFRPTHSAVEYYNPIVRK